MSKSSVGDTYGLLHISKKYMYFFLYPGCKLINKEMFPTLPQPACFKSSHNTVSVYLYWLPLSQSPALYSLLTDLFPRQLLFSMQPQSLRWIMNFPSTIVSVFAAALEGHIFSPLADFPLVFQASSHIILLQLYCPIICQTTCSFFFRATLHRFCALVLYMPLRVNFFSLVLYQPKIFHIKQCKTHH